MAPSGLPQILALFSWGRTGGALHVSVRVVKLRPFCAACRLKGWRSANHWLTTSGLLEMRRSSKSVLRHFLLLIAFSCFTLLPLTDHTLAYPLLLATHPTSEEGPSVRPTIKSRPISSPAMRPSNSRPRFTPTLPSLAMWQAPYDDYPGLILDPDRPDSIFDRVSLRFTVHLEGVDVDSINENPPPFHPCRLCMLAAGWPHIPRLLARLGVVALECSVCASCCGSSVIQE